MSKGASCRAACVTAALVLSLCIAAPGLATPERAGTAVADPHSYANPTAFITRHLELDLDVDFASQRLAGHVDLELARLDPDARRLTLDTRALDIVSIARVRGDGSLEPLEFRLREPDAILGAALDIDVPRDATDTVRIRIAYRTDPGSTGLQWLAPEQTAGRRHPFLYTQSQAIHARSWIPLQDTPQVRFTYAARVRTPPALRAVMSAENDPLAARDGEYTFEMPQPIPSYLIALGVGDLEFEPLGERTGVYAEPPVVAAAAREFAAVESMLETCEKMFGPYRWGRYDLLILPPSFPWGGMENPRLSFITPTVIAGDRSLTALIAHELAHSWSGNLVTNATWNDVWLNEGFTVYLERRIMERLYGTRRATMEDALGVQSLERDIATLEEAGDTALTALEIELAGRDPDDAFTDVPYEKGRRFLGFLESRVGKERLDRFLREYFDDFAFESITTREFRDYLERTLLADEDVTVTQSQIDEWLRGTGIPKSAALPASEAFVLVDRQREAWLDGRIEASGIDVDAWTTHEWLHFLDNLPPSIPSERLAELDAAFELTDSQNAQIAHSWLLAAIESGYAPAYPRLEEYLVSIGRRKLVKDLYEALVETPAGRELARRIYERARPGYHVVLTSQLDEIVGTRGGVTAR